MYDGALKTANKIHMVAVLQSYLMFVGVVFLRAVA
jgi:hypothetical protein